MNSVQMHLALTHVPVILSLVGLVILVVALFKNKNSLIQISYIIIMIAGVAALPVFFSGEGAEEAIEHLPGISETVVERHEEVAELAMITICVAGFFALAGLLTFRLMLGSLFFRVFVLLLTVTSGGLMVQTAHLGGQIRHTEINNKLVIQNSDQIPTGKEVEVNRNQQRGNDD